MKPKPIRLTPYQMGVLKRFQAGEVMFRCVHTSLARDDSFYFDAGGAKFRRSAVDALLKSELIEDFEKPAWRWRGSKYRITAAGMEVGRG